MKKVLIIVFLVSVATAAYAHYSMDLLKTENFAVDNASMPGVIFPHRKHQQANTCTECHLQEKGGKDLRNQLTEQKLVVPKVNSQTVAHAAFCWHCHDRKSVPVDKNDCIRCHTVQ